MPVRTLVKRPPVACSATDTIAHASRTMVEQGVGSIVVLDAHGAPQGIVTDRDLRKRVVAAGRSPEGAVRTVMSSPVIALSPEALIFEALVEMTRRDIHHLVVVEAGRLVGVVSSHDLLLLQASAPLELTRRIQLCKSLDALADAMPALSDGVRALFEQGLSGYQIGRIVAEMNDLVIRRVLALTEAELHANGDGAPPVPYCWVVLGSEGRREQTLHTDQDNALVYEAPSPVVRETAERYFRALGDRVVNNLVNLGYPRCPGGSMASNPRWCQPLGVWRQYFIDWVREPVEQNLLYSSIYFDLRPVAGKTALATALRDEVRAQVAAWRSFPRHLAKIAVSQGVPLRLFSRFRTERREGRRGINLKLNGLLIVINALRTYAVDLGLDETNTIERLEAATSVGCFTRADADDVREAYETMFHLRLRAQLTRMAAGERPDNLVDPRALSRNEQQRLKDAFRVVERLQGRLEMRYFTEPL